MPELTIHPSDFGDRAPTAGRQFEIRLLTHPDLSTFSFVGPHGPIVEDVRAFTTDGSVDNTVIDLLANSSITPQSVYAWIVAGRPPRYFTMPDTPARLKDRLSQYLAAPSYVNPQAFDAELRNGNLYLSFRDDAGAAHSFTIPFPEAGLSAAAVAGAIASQVSQEHQVAVALVLSALFDLDAPAFKTIAAAAARRVAALAATLQAGQEAALEIQGHDLILLAHDNLLALPPSTASLANASLSFELTNNGLATGDKVAVGRNAANHPLIQFDRALGRKVRWRRLSATHLYTEGEINAFITAGTEPWARPGNAALVPFNKVAARPSNSIGSALLAPALRADIASAFQAVAVDDVELTFYDADGNAHRANLLAGVRDVLSAAVLGGAHSGIVAAWNSQTHAIDLSVADGARGPKGDKGDPGAAGRDGAAGARGPKGDKGDPGATTAAGVSVATGDLGELLDARATTVQKAINQIDDRAQPRSEELAELLAAILPTAWDQTGASSNSRFPYVGKPFSTVRVPSNVESSFSFHALNDYAPESNGYFAVLKIPVSIPRAEYKNYRLFIGRQDGTYDLKNVILLSDASKVHFLETTSGFSYFTVLMDDKPADDVVFVQRHHLLEMRAEDWANIPAPLLGNVPLPPIQQTLGTQFTIASPEVSTTSSRAPKQSAAVGLTVSGTGAVWDFDDSDKQHGVFYGEDVISITSTGVDPNFGFEQKANQDDDDRVLTVPFILYASDIIAAPSVSDLGGVHSVLAIRKPFYSLNTLLGYAQLWFGRDGLNQAELINRYEPSSGNAHNYTIRHKVRLSFLHFDTGAATQPADIDARINALTRAFALAATSDADARQALAALLNAAVAADQKLGLAAVGFTDRLLSAASAADANKVMRINGAGDAWELVAGDWTTAAAALAQVRNFARTHTRDADATADLFNLLGARVLPAADRASVGEIVQVGANGAWAKTNPPRAFTVGVSPPANVDLQMPAPSNSGAWTAWTELCAAAALTASQAGVLNLTAQIIGVVQAAPPKNFRFYLDLRIIRTRGQAATTLASSIIQIRNTVSNTANALSNTVSRNGATSISAGDMGVAGDVYKLEVRALGTLNATAGGSYAPTIRFTPGNNSLRLLGAGF